MVCHRTIIKDAGPRTEPGGRQTKGLQTDTEMGRGLECEVGCLDVYCLHTQLSLHSNQHDMESYE